MPEIFCYISTKELGQWRIKIHGPHGAKSFNQKHVHLWRKGLNGEYSWNIDRSRHDKHRFPASDQQMKRAKEIASKALRIPIGTLQLLVAVPGGSRIAVQVIDSSTRPRTLLSTYVRVNEQLVLFGASEGLIAALIEIE